LLAGGTPAINLVPAQIVSTLAVGPALKTKIDSKKFIFKEEPITVM
jgi:hypothetical protein